jgi:hypothetical protein
MNGLQRIIGTAIISGAILGSPAFGAPKPEEEKGPEVSCALEVQYAATLGTPIITTDTVPEYIRAVPEHIDDGGKNLPPIQDKPISIGSGISAEGRLEGIIKDKNLKFEFGLLGGVEIMFGDLVEYNYTNAPGTEARGYGAALTFYKSYLLNLNVGVFGNGIFDLAPPSLFPKIVLEYSSTLPFLQGIYIKNGWDRYDSYETKDRYFAYLLTLNQKIKCGLELPLGEGESSPTVLILGGMNIPTPLFESEVAKGMGLKLKPSFFGEIRFKFSTEKF